MNWWHLYLGCCVIAGGVTVVSYLADSEKARGDWLRAGFVAFFLMAMIWPVFLGWYFFEKLRKWSERP